MGKLLGFPEATEAISHIWMWRVPRLVAQDDYADVAPTRSNPTSC
jgi:hypothetical protein